MTTTTDIISDVDTVGSAVTKGFSSVWTHIIGWLLGAVVLLLTVLYCMHLRHQNAALRANAAAVTISTKADGVADKTYTVAHKATITKKEKASATIQAAVEHDPVHTAENFPDELADALRDPDAVPNRVRTLSKGTAPSGQVPAAVPSDLPAVPAVQ